ncbi:hypothetical protein GCM10011512_16040 [Tersicoccus solisilvae]|uniref:D-inositol 3-phosphate glycosyltransferase n=1 Tax=Tersicoccus solisilvae TaxID=1882339 RepID=A0ABQ1P3G8_9MICC|nr:hypothetical protein GCM10011512_16040 [Tersicoccus solisilvae]
MHLAHRDTSIIRARMREDGLEPTRENSVLTSFGVQGEQVFAKVRDTFEPEAVHVHDHVVLTAAGRFKETFGCPIVWDAHEIYEDLAGLEDVRRVVNPRIIRENVPNIDAFITLNRSIADFYAEKYPGLPTATLVPNAVERVSMSEYDGRLHDAAGLARDQRVLLFQGGFAPHRGIPSLLEAATLLDERWSLVFMGWGKLDGQIDEAAARADDRPEGRSRIAKIPGAPHDELLSWTAGASLGAIPYEDTGLNHRFCSPNKLWEYPAAGVPMLATDMPEMALRINEWGIGITVGRELDPHDIAARVNAVTAADLDRMRESCAQFTANDNWQAYEPRIADIYAGLMHEAAASDATADAERDHRERAGTASGLWGRLVNSSRKLFTN